MFDPEIVGFVFDPEIVGSAVNPKWEFALGVAPDVRHDVGRVSDSQHAGNVHQPSRTYVILLTHS